MKPSLLHLTTCVLLLATATHAQTIRRVNNNPGVTGVNVYTTAQAAHGAAVANDIVIIEPSGTSYGDLTFSKPLKIYGNGHLADVHIVGTSTSICSNLLITKNYSTSNIYLRGTISNIIVSNNIAAAILVVGKVLLNSSL